jgi:GNAT superfamily N-acetyltransferase
MTRFPDTDARKSVNIPARATSQQSRSGAALGEELHASGLSRWFPGNLALRHRGVGERSARRHAGFMRVRRAGANDAAVLQELYRELVPGDPNISVDPAHLAALETDRFSQIWVIELDGSVCGTAFLTICRDAMYGDQPFGTVESVVVAARARGRGAGTALMAEVERAARAARCTKLMLLSASARREAHAFYSRLGYDGERKRGFVKYLNRKG